MIEVSIPINWFWLMQNLDGKQLYQLRMPILNYLKDAGYEFPSNWVKVKPNLIFNSDEEAVIFKLTHWDRLTGLLKIYDM